jgi:hypothetical protein
MKDEERGEISKLLARAAALGPELAAAADDLNQQIETIENELVALKLGAGATVQIHAPSGADGSEWLSFKKHGGKWRLVIERASGAGSEYDRTIEPLRSASLERRREAVPLFPALLRNMIQNAESEIQALRKSTEETADFAAAVNKALK